MPLRLLANVPLTNYYPDRLAIASVSLAEGSLRRRTLRLLKALRTADVYLGFNSGAETYLAGFFHRLLGGRARIVLWDSLLHQPRGLQGRLVAKAKAFLFRWVDYFFSVHKDTRAYTEHYGIDPKKFVYVPFKANNYEILDSISVEDGGYVLSCGASYRDFDCLLSAVEGLDVPVKIVLPARSLAEYHHTHFRADRVPGNVTVVEHDMNKQTWNEHLAKATIVVLPIAAHCIQPAGISVYLEAMALGKPVVISRGPSTEQLLDDSMAALFEPGNARQLRCHILELLSDKALRERIGTAGRRYARSLGGETRLVLDLEGTVLDLFGRRL